MSEPSSRRPTPEEMLSRVRLEERQASRGYHKVFLGFAAGVGKTFEMLAEANRRCRRGEDVVMGLVETHGRKSTAEQIGDLEAIPRRNVSYRGTVLEEMDAEAILERRPAIVLVDELAHTNVPGSARQKRWQDVEMLLEAGIGVLSTMNVQHLESLNDTIHDITGIRVRETVPDRIIHEANEVVLVDITPQALMNRLERGDVYPAEKVDRALRSFFREGNLSALREIALREIAHEVDEDLTAYRRRKRIASTWATKERVMVCISAARPSLRLIRRGWRIAQALHADIVAVYVQSAAERPSDQATLAEDLALADRLGISVTTLHGEVADELIRYSREHQITQIVLGHSHRSRWHEMLHGSIINRLARELRALDLVVVAAGENDA